MLSCFRFLIYLRCFPVPDFIHHILFAIFVAGGDRKNGTTAAKRAAAGASASDVRDLPGHQVRARHRRHHQAVPELLVNREDCTCDRRTGAGGNIVIVFDPNCPTHGSKAL